MRCLNLLTALVLAPGLAMGCTAVTNDSDFDTEDGSGTSGGSSSTSSSTDAGSSSGSGTTGGSTGSDSDSASSTGGPSTSGGTGSTGSGETGGTGLGTTTFGSTGGSGSTGGVEPLCSVVSGDYGACASELGWGFDGDDCVLHSGCDCAPDCDAIFDTIDGCTGDCQSQGFCDESVFKGYGLAPDGWGLMQYCDDLSVCVSNDMVDLVKAIVPAASCSPDPGLCNDDQRCVLEYSVAVGQFYINMACELSMVPGLDAVTCSTY